MNENKFKMKILDKIFYRFYALMISVGNQMVAGWYSVLAIVFLLSINIITIHGLAYFFLDHVPALPLNSKSSIILFLVIVIGILYLLFIRNGRYLKIAELYKDETRSQKIKGIAFVILYIILSFGLQCLSFYLMWAKNNGTY